MSVWRELRRIEKSAVADAPDVLRRAWLAAQRQRHVSGEEYKRADYAEFIRAWGGPWIKRQDATIRLHKEAQFGTGRYGDALGPRIAGIVVRDECAVDSEGIVSTIDAVVEKIVLSVRRLWPIVKHRAAEFLPSRTRVNNCTPVSFAKADEKSLTDLTIDLEPEQSNSLSCQSLFMASDLIVQ